MNINKKVSTEFLLKDIFIVFTWHKNCHKVTLYVFSVNHFKELISLYELVNKDWTLESFSKMLSFPN